MKIKFNPDLDFQADAIASIVDLFEGQETCQTNFTVGAMDATPQLSLGISENSPGIGNYLKLLNEDILANIGKVQLRNGLKPSTALGDLNFTVEMETGTGKTYVYLRSIFELNRKYGFTKFIVVVPSVAIKEGVKKSLEMTEEHFKGLFDNVRFDYFVYDSQKLGQVRNFATSDCIQIMVINIDAFRRSFADPSKESKANIIHRPNDRMTGAKPIEFIQATNPIVIIDEPQSVDTTKKSTEALASLNPLCTFRYSATHQDKHHQVFRLDSVDAYERKLVKQIEVAGVTVADSHNNAYVRLLSVDNRNGISARIEYDAIRKGQIKREQKKVKTGVDLVELSGGRDVYDGYIIEEIYCAEGQEYISFTGTETVVRLGQTIGEVDDDEYKRLQIRKTIDEHLDKELRLRPKGIKVLSLFFIDRVANYRAYDADGNPVKGKYALMFEEEYAKAIKKPKYSTLFEDVDLKTAADGVHNGYFAQDKKKDASGNARLKESKGGGTTADDEGAYHLIMRDKEKLLSFDSKLKFIFSHSALREGWDNPNVFQICTLNETSSVMKKRQEIGRGLRICVDQEGERVYGFEVNTLTVMANESYEEFARKLQKEIEEDTGIRFGLVEQHLFANIPVQDANGAQQPLGVETSKKVWEHLKKEGYVDNRGKVTDKLRRALNDDSLELPNEVAEQAGQIAALLNKVAGSLNVKNAEERTKVSLNKERFLGEDFKALWDRIKYKTTFQVSFDTEALIETCADEIKKSPVVTKARFVYRKSKTEISRGGIGMGEAFQQTYSYDAEHMRPPDIVSFLQNETNLTRRSIVEILRRSGRLGDFKRNPNKFIEQVSEIIKSQMRLFIVDGIKYHRIGDDAFYGQELFKDQELFGYLSKNMVKTEKSVYDHVVYDSDVERKFAERLDQSGDVKVFAKLPDWFKIETPLGTYNPDWAVLVEREDVERLFFIVETKGSLLTDALRPTEQGKIDCGKAHFKALGTNVGFAVANSYDSFEGTFDAH
ncbi:type III restriction endonuclease subunit R [Marichromatium purpuratum 984]|uniref:Type III restriction endonuclease subunit R n=1 Tax=Marichromatium purpuratum 984 TaxID=765910 RepID=W0E5R8_MARPU|nr:DEAD/DEAH box helicase family protein [Marichromatium purpuratum]AHF04559.1 type III restriction endonuclease subunit R [Marichromatium purpuratum 984]